MTGHEPPSLYALIAAMAGGISGLAFVRWKDMGWIEICLTIFVGTTCAFFVAPWLTYYLFGVPTDAGRTVAMTTYVTGVGAHILLPPLIRFLGRALGEKA
jgi:hypothetical protein